MLRLERSPSHSWWWDSHNSPKHSRWLQSNLQDLDEKVKEMLRLIEEDADSFAQRAEMYYQKRPELVNLVEEFYRAYRSLAERYDHLTGEIRQNIPRALQVQYGLSCDSPKSLSMNGSRHHFSPLRRSNHMFETLSKKVCQMEDQAKSSDQQTGDCTQSMQGKCVDDVCIENAEQNGHDDQHNSSDGGLSTSSSDSEVDNLTPLTRLQQEIEELKESNRMVAESHQRALHLNSSLQSKVKELEGAYKSKTDEADNLRSKVDVLSEDLLCFRSVYKAQHSAVSMNNEQEKALHAEILPHLEEEIDSCTGDKDASCNTTELFKDTNVAAECNSIKLKSSQEQRLALLDGLQNHIAQLEEENRNQKLVILEREEEKREAIRQLCFSMDVLKSKNQRLEATLGLLNKKLAVSNVRTTCHLSAPVWRQLFSVGDWRCMKRGQPFATVAL